MAKFWRPIRQFLQSVPIPAIYGLSVDDVKAISALTPGYQQGLNKHQAEMLAIGCASVGSRGVYWEPPVSVKPMCTPEFKRQAVRELYTQAPGIDAGQPTVPIDKNLMGLLLIFIPVALAVIYASN